MTRQSFINRLVVLQSGLRSIFAGLGLGLGLEKICNQVHFQFSLCTFALVFFWSVTSYSVQDCVVLTVACSAACSSSANKGRHTAIFAIDFYRPTLCVSAVFAVARYPSVRPSIYLSRWWIVSRRLKISSNLKLLPRPGSLITLVFLSPSAGTQFQGEPLQQGRKIHRGGEILPFNFRLKSPFISETVGDRPQIVGGGSIRVCSNDLEWP